MSDSRPPFAASRLALSRRMLLAGAAAGFVARGFPLSPARAAQATGPQPPGAWRTWLLTSGDEVRPAPPPPPSADEVAEVVALQANRTAATAATIDKWAVDPPIIPWTDLALALI